MPTNGGGAGRTRTVGEDLIRVSRRKPASPIAHWAEPVHFDRAWAPPFCWLLGIALLVTVDLTETPYFGDVLANLVDVLGRDLPNLLYQCLLQFLSDG